MLQTLQTVIKAKHDAYSAIKSIIQDMQVQSEKLLSTIDVNRETYKQRLMTHYNFDPVYNFPRGYPEHRDGSSEGSSSKNIPKQRFSPHEAPEKLTHNDRKTDLSIVANMTQSEGQYDDPEEGEEEDNDSEAIEISNSFFADKGACFVSWEQRGLHSPEKQGRPKVRRLSLGPTQFRSFFRNKLTAISKFPGDNNGNMALWIGGMRDLIGLARNKSDMTALELAPEDDVNRSYTSHISYLNGYVIFFTVHYRLVVVDLSGQVAFISEISSLFSRNDYVICSIADSESSCLVLGSNDGKVIVIEIDVEQKCIVKGYSQTHFVKRLSSLTWLDEEKKIFIATSYDRTCSVLQYDGRDSIILLRSFSYDLSVSCCIKMGSLLLLAFPNFMVSIVEPEEGQILFSYRVQKSKTKGGEFSYINWLGYIFLGNNQEMQSYINADYRYRQEAFEALLQRLRVISKFDDHSIVITGYPNEPGSHLEINMVDPKAYGQAHLDSRKLPVIMERFADTSIRLRFFTIMTSGDPGSPNNRIKQDKNEEDEFQTSMGEVDIFLTEDLVPTKAKANGQLFSNV